MEQSARLHYLKNVLGIKSVLIPENYVLSKKEVSAGLNTIATRCTFFFQTSNKGQVLFLTDAKNDADTSFSIAELQLLEKIIVALKLNFSKTDIAKVFVEKYPDKIDRTNLAKEIIEKKYSHVFILGEYLSKMFSDSDSYFSNIVEVDGLIAFTSFHPNDLIQNQELKKDAWSFFKTIMEKLPK